MTIFFLLIGLELKQELYSGELSTVQKAALPVIAALGGMIIPAFIYFSINVNRGDTAGVGIPMATDIAFAHAVLSLVGKGIPTSVKVFLTALAVIDDLGAILVIAVLYTDTLHWINLAIAMSILLTLAALNRLKVNLAFAIHTGRYSLVILYDGIRHTRNYLRSYAGVCYSVSIRRSVITITTFTKTFA